MNFPPLFLFYEIKASLIFPKCILFGFATKQRNCKMKYAHKIRKLQYLLSLDQRRLLDIPHLQVMLYISSV